MEKTKLKMNKHAYLGMSILDVNKTLMYKFRYDCIKPKYGDRYYVIQILVALLFIL